MVTDTRPAPPLPTGKHERLTRDDAYEEGRDQRDPCGHLSPCGCNHRSRPIADCCFQCPLAHCRYDEDAGLLRQQATNRKTQIIALNNDHVPRPAIAQRVGVSLRRVHHYLQAPAHPELN